MCTDKDPMRSVRDLLRDYNFVNTPEGRRNTVRFFGAFAAIAAGAFMVFFIAFSNGGDDPEATFQYGSKNPDDRFTVTVSYISGNEWYIGYPTQFYEAEDRDQYNEREIDARIAQWQSDYDIEVRSMEPVYSEDEHNVLLGYHIQAADLFRILPL